eukprot:6461391-Amphidinium_carterae.1
MPVMSAYYSTLVQTYCVPSRAISPSQSSNSSLRLSNKFFNRRELQASKQTTTNRNKQHHWTTIQQKRGSQTVGPQSSSVRNSGCLRSILSVKFQLPEVFQSFGCTFCQQIENSVGKGWRPFPVVKTTKVIHNPR